MAYFIKSTVSNWNLTHKKVIVRADLNVPLIDTSIADDFRLRQIQPTLDALIARNASIILITHLGRPQQHDHSLSTRILLPWFTQHNYTIEFAQTLEEAHEKKSSIKDNSLLLLENVRFFEGETNQHKDFARCLASLGEFYINDAFGTLHRSDSSVSLVPRFFDEQHRSIGLLVEHELHMLNKLLINPKRPFVLILGGAKVHEKIPIIEHLLDIIDCLILCPAIVFTFMQAQGKQTGKSLIDITNLQTCKAIIKKAKDLGKNIIMPADFKVALHDLYGPCSLVPTDNIPDNAVGISIGPKTERLIHKELITAGTIFYNGLMGLENRPETLDGFRATLESMVQSPAYTVIGGGDTVSAARQLGLATKLDFCSTGGGATLAYMSGKPLPGIESLIQPGHFNK